MSLGSDDIKKIAHLARLSVNDNQLDDLKHDLDSILGLVEKMDSVDTTQVEPLSHPFDQTQPMRTDQVTEINQRELFQKIAPEVKSGLYIVPQFVETE